MFNFRSGSAVAIQQDQYIQIYKNSGFLTSKQISDMEQNVWIIAAAKTAPNNLVIRNYALVDVFKKTPANKDTILKYVDLLSYNSTEPWRIWSEGYSYFRYTMEALDLWIRTFENQSFEIQNIIQKIRLGFVVTSYTRNNILYPAPFGDLRNEPLPADLQLPQSKNDIAVSNVKLRYVTNAGILHVYYLISGKPIGLNTHIPKDDYVTEIINGMPQGFRFYQGYDKKYKNYWQELSDTFDPKRVKSIPF